MNKHINYRHAKLYVIKNNQTIKRLLIFSAQSKFVLDLFYVDAYVL